MTTLSLKHEITHFLSSLKHKQGTLVFYKTLPQAIQRHESSFAPGDEIFPINRHSFQHQKHQIRALLQDEAAQNSSLPGPSLSSTIFFNGVLFKEFGTRCDSIPLYQQALGIAAPQNKPKAG